MEVRLWWRTRAGAVRRQLSRCAARHGDGHRSGFAGAYGDGLTHGKGPDPSNRLSTHELGPTSAPTRIATRASARPSPVMPSGQASSLSASSTMRLYPARTRSRPARLQSTPRAGGGQRRARRHRRGCQPICPASADPKGRHFVAGWPGRTRPDRRRRRPEPIATMNSGSRCGKSWACSRSWKRLGW